MSDTDKQNYELAYHISSNLDDAGVQRARQDVENVVVSHKGTIVFSKDPEKIRLAYPIKHQSYAYFGYFNFNIESGDSISEIKNDLNLSSDILRILVLKIHSDSKTTKEDVVRKLAMAEKRRARMTKQAEKPIKEDDSKISEKEIEEKLEEIIDKL